MRFTVVDCEQRSLEWTHARLGRLCGSRANDMLAEGRTKGQESKSRRNLRVQLALERIVGRSMERQFTTYAMQDGTEREPDAAMLYEVTTGNLLQTSGYLAMNDVMAGVSLDGYVGDFEGVVEIKSPIHATHLEYLKSGRVPLDYYRQCLHALYVTGAKWCDWFSYQPDFPEGLRLKLVRIERNDAEIADYESKVRIFLEEVAREEQSIRTMANLSGQLSASVAV